MKVEYVRMPPEQVAAYWAAVEVIAGLLSDCTKKATWALALWWEQAPFIWGMGRDNFLRLRFTNLRTSVLEYDL